MLQAVGWILICLAAIAGVGRWISYMYRLRAEEDDGAGRWRRGGKD